jgi:hypothetical protein
VIYSLRHQLRELFPTQITIDYADLQYEVIRKNAVKIMSVDSKVNR